MAKFRTIDLCCGMGGLSYAAQQAGLKIGIGIDISNNALCSYKHNFPDALAINKNISEIGSLQKEILAYGSMRTKSAGTVIVSGPPCQGFSDAGSRCIEDPRNEVLVTVAKAIVGIRPEAALVENVYSLRKTKFSTIFRRFRAILNTADYHVYGFELNALQFGVAQNRRRMFYYVLPFCIKKRHISNELKKFHRTPKSVKEIIGDLPVPPVRPPEYDPAKDNGGIANHISMRHSQTVREKIAAIKPGKGPLSYRKLDPDSYAATLLSGHRAPPAHYGQPRSITVREALRLQGFPDSFRVMGTFASQMEQVTNAVPAPLGKAVLKVILKILGET